MLRFQWTMAHFICNIIVYNIWTILQSRSFFKNNFVITLKQLSIHIFYFNLDRPFLKYNAIFNATCGFKKIISQKLEWIRKKKN